MPVPGGLRSAVDDAHFLLDLIRSSCDSEPSGRRPALPGPSVRELVAHLERSSQANASPSPAHDSERMGVTGHAVAETLPLPLPEQVWIDVVFGGRATPRTLLAGILRSRNTALFYYGLLSLDDETRAWLANEPRLIRDLVARYSASFRVAAPGLRVAAGRIRPPGGESAVPAWEALVGRPTSRPEEFVRALLAGGDGRLAYFFAAMAPLSDRQLRFGLQLGADPGQRVEAVRRLYRAFEQVAGNWDVEDSPFRRPTLDPAMLLADLTVDHRGDPILPGAPSFWSALLDAELPGTTPPAEEAARRMAQGGPVDFSWLCEQLSRGGPYLYRRGHLMVLFASRVVKGVTPETAGDAIDAIRAAGSYPALATALERAGVDDVAVFARAARRAAQLSRIADDTRAARSLAQYQGAIFVLARAALRGVLSAGAVNDAVASLVTVEPSQRGDYQGRLVHWLGAFLESRGPRVSGRPSSDGPGLAAPLGSPGAQEMPPLDVDLLRVLAGERDVDLPIVEWEGSRYRVDFASAEAARLARLLGENPRPYVASAKALVEIADRVSLPGQTPEALRAHATALEDLLRAAGWEGDVRDELERAARTSRSGEASHLAVTLRLLADDLLARGLVQYAYAVALGQPSRATVSAGEVASRHDFGPSDKLRRAAWHLPTERSDERRGWYVSGSILGIDVTLADHTLVGISSKPPPRAPTVDPRERQALTEAVVLVEPAALTDADMRTIVTALGRGRERVARLRTREEAAALADEIRLGPERRTLLAWTVTRRPEWLATFLAPVELFWLGLEGAPIGATLHAWGAPAVARTGCLCLHLGTPLPLETLAGRWDPALLTSGFSDLNLRLAELLSQLDMPASLLAPVLAAATLDLVNTAHMRGRDDRRGLETFVRELRVDHVEQYLALLTTGGPLVPVEQSTAGERFAPSPGVRR